MKIIKKLQISAVVILISIHCSGCSSSLPKAKYDIEYILAKDFIVPIDTSYLKKVAISHVVRGSSLQNKDEHALAALEFLDALRHDESAGIYFALANSYRKTYKFELAIDALKKALTLNNDFEPAYILLAEILLPLKQYQEAIRILELCYEKFKREEMLLYIASVYEYFDAKKALEYYDRIPKDKLDLYTLHKIGELARSIEDFERFTNALNLMIEKAPDNYAPHSGLVEYYLMIDSLKSALDMVISTEKRWTFEQQRALYSQIGIYFLNRLFPIDTTQAIRFINKIDNRFEFEDFLRFTAGTVAQQIGDTTKADKHLGHLLRNSDNEAFSPVEIARVYLFGNRYDKVLSTLLNYDNIEQDARVPHFIGIAKMQTNRYADAEPYMLEALKLEPNNADIIGSLGYIYHELNEIEKSDEYFKRALVLMPESAMLNNNYAYTMAEQGRDLQKAKKMSEFSILKEPDNASYLDTYGWILYKLGDLEKALKYLQKAYNNKTEASVEIYLHLIEVYVKLNDTRNAQKIYSEALDLFPTNKKLLDLSNEIK